MPRTPARLSPALIPSASPIISTSALKSKCGRFFFPLHFPHFYKYKNTHSLGGTVAILVHRIHSLLMTGRRAPSASLPESGMMLVGARARADLPPRRHRNWRGRQCPGPANASSPALIQAAPGHCPAGRAGRSAALTLFWQISPPPPSGKELEGWGLGRALAGDLLSQSERP